MTVEQGNLVLVYAPMVNISETSSRLQQRTDEGADFYEIELLRRKSDGSIECLECFSDIDNEDKANIILGQLESKYPHAEVDILAE